MTIIETEKPKDEKEVIQSTEAPREDLPVMLSKERARELTDEVKELGSKLWLKLADLYDGSAHISLGYNSWRDYWENEFASSGTRGEQLLRAGRVAQALQAVSLPMPVNDTVARELTPLLKDPQKLQEVWGSALEAADGKPIGSQVRELVAPYRRKRTGGSTVDGRNTRAVRNRVSKPLISARGSLKQVYKDIDDAMKTKPKDTQVRDWLSNAREVKNEAEKVISKLERAAKD